MANIFALNGLSTLIQLGLHMIPQRLANRLGPTTTTHIDTIRILPVRSRPYVRSNLSAKPQPVMDGECEIFQNTTNAEDRIDVLVRVQHSAVSRPSLVSLIR